MPLIIITILGVVYILPRKASKNEVIANSRIEDRFCEDIRVLDTSRRSMSLVKQCSSAPIHSLQRTVVKEGSSVPNRSVKYKDVNKVGKTIKKSGVDMAKISALNMKRTKEVRALATLKAEHAAKVARRDVASKVRMYMLVAGVLATFVTVGVYFASSMSLYWVAVPSVFAVGMGFYSHVRGIADRRDTLIEKKQIVLLQKRLASSSRFTSSKAKVSVPNVVETSVAVAGDGVVSEVVSEVRVDGVVDEVSATDKVVGSSKWSAPVIPTPLYARSESVSIDVATHDDVVDEVSSSRVYRPNALSNFDESFSSDELVESQVRFDLEEVIRSRTAG